MNSRFPKRFSSLYRKRYWTHPEQPDRYLPRKRQQSGVELLPIGEAEVCQVHRLPAIHRDPFDRLLIAQANCHGLVLVTDDPTIGQYPVRTLW